VLRTGCIPTGNKISQWFEPVVFALRGRDA
jgi:hypothetical protein